MDFQFSIAYNTVLGQCIKMLIYDDAYKLLACHELRHEDGNWLLDLESVKTDFNYSYVLFENGKAINILNRRFFINTNIFRKKKVKVIDDWNPVPTGAPILITKPFDVLLANSFGSEGSTDKKAKWSHIIKADVLPMQSRYIPCITGESSSLNDWDNNRPLLMQQKNGIWELKILLDPSLISVGYKIALYDKVDSKIIAYQEGENCQLQNCKKEEQVMVHQLVNFEKYLWKGAGLNLPLSSLRTERSWGVGEFTDLYALVDWVKATGLQLIQLLPINDTTATHTDADSYPYSAISAFALHPMHLNVRKISAPRLIKLPATFLDKAKTLNEADTLQYAAANELKWEVIQFIFKQIGNSFLEDEQWKTFYADNKEWLLPYAAYCFYRDMYKTSDFKLWKKSQTYDAIETELLFTESNAAFSKVAIHLFVQYHLHLQLADAISYANKNNIVFKADLPIGVGRSSVDVWVNPNLFHMQLQAGAPPDSFSSIGQNWYFPTYNWEKMKEDDHDWWRKRMGQLSKYFDAVRIDHILGFFRIWSIPMTEVIGILGRFNPAIPLSTEQIMQYGILFSEERFCKPYLTLELLYEKFGDSAEWVQSTLLDGLKFKQEFDTQRKLADYFAKNKSHEHLLDGLFNLMANVIFIRDEKDYHYHFRINVFETSSYNSLDDNNKRSLNELYNKYFFEMQNELWKEAGILKLEALQSACNNMLLCGEDLGMVPNFVPSVLSEQHILSLQVERMPKKSDQQFSHPEFSAYDAVVTPGTHDMSTLRGWWMEDRDRTQKFYNNALGREGAAPQDCTPDVAMQIIAQHLYSPAMFSVFLMQDLLAMNDRLVKTDPSKERINDPADPNHLWNYRMPVLLETLIADATFSSDLQKLITASGRGIIA